MSAFMLLTGLPITADEALRAGLISKLAKDSEHLEEVFKDFNFINKKSPKEVILP
jgi:enoyl-CoA hydratase/carnithine racemase